MFTVPDMPVTNYVDLYGNRCRRLVAPSGDFKIWIDTTLEVDGVPDRVRGSASEIPVPELPAGCLIYLMGSRYCQTDLMSQTAWDLFGALPPGWSRVQAICDFVHRHVRFDYQQARATRSAFDVFQERVGVCRDYAHLALTFCRCPQHSSPLCERVSRRYRCSGCRTHGFQCLDRGLSRRRLAHFRSAQQHSSDRPIVVARGRDAADVPLINSFGPHLLKSFRVWTHEVQAPL